MSGPAELGRKGLPQADLLSAAPERGSLRRVGAAGGDCGRPSRRFPFAALNQSPGGVVPAAIGGLLALLAPCVMLPRQGRQKVTVKHVTLNARVCSKTRNSSGSVISQPQTIRPARSISTAPGVSCAAALTGSSNCTLTIIGAARIEGARCLLRPWRRLSLDRSRDCRSDPVPAINADLRPEGI